MPTHDEFAYAVAQEVVGTIRQGSHPWADIFSVDSHVTSSRGWPIPDFVISDNGNRLTLAAEFKPPHQSKREYLTGLGQAVAYTRDFDYGFLIIPQAARDGYRISDHVEAVLSQREFTDLPVGLISYDSATISIDAAGITVARFAPARGQPPTTRARLGTSFYAKWRELSPEEMACYLRYLYEEGLAATSGLETIRDRAFARLWDDIQAGKLHHWGGGIRNAADNPNNYTAWRKNYSNFMAHIGWIAPDGALSENGFEAFQIAHVYGSSAVMFTDYLARTLLTLGKHLILLNAIEEHQVEAGPFAEEQAWLDSVEAHLGDKGLLKRNVGRAQAAVAGSRRQFLKAEKQLWKKLNLVVPRGNRVYHPGRGFVFNWTRITSLISP
ncbi:hypothetical protein [Candidatus Palauibacter sp.]|uniref:hypothetical protein n=1 Tax=Candidatus Palauibacter sp. TaxID=3101350 RepID=UPI003AF278AF